MNPGNAQIAGAAALALVMLGITTAFHYEALRLLGWSAGRRSVSQRRAVGFLTTLVALHLTEIALYQSLRGCANVFGSRVARQQRTACSIFYFAAETYPLGYGDLVPVGALRRLASVESLNGLLLRAWSGAFLFGVLDSRTRRG